MRKSHGTIWLRGTLEGISRLLFLSKNPYVHEFDCYPGASPILVVVPRVRLLDL